MVHKTFKSSINDWDSEYIKKAERNWGQKTPPYTLDMFNFAIKNCNSWLDLGCGFGRFLKYLLSKHSEPDYIGYDSSTAMISRIQDLYPEYSIRTFHRDITKPINHFKQSILISAIFIHLKHHEQLSVLNNIKKLDPLPKSITLDINSFTTMCRKSDYFIERTSERNFRMSYQAQQVMTAFLKSNFKEYSLKSKQYPIRRGISKTAYFLERLGK